MFSLQCSKLYLSCSVLIWFHCLRSYSRCAVGPGGPLAVPPPDFCCFSHFFCRRLVTSLSATLVHSLHTLMKLFRSAFIPSTVLFQFSSVNLKQALRSSWRFPSEDLSLQVINWFPSAILRCQWKRLRLKSSVFSNPPIKLLLWTKRCRDDGGNNWSFQLLWSLSSVCQTSVSALLFLPPIWLSPECCISPPPALPASIPLSLHPSNLSTPPPRPLPAFLQQLLSLHTFHLSYPGHATPLHPLPVAMGAGCCVLGVRMRRLTW